MAVPAIFHRQQFKCLYSQDGGSAPLFTYRSNQAALQKPQSPLLHSRQQVVKSYTVSMVILQAAKTNAPLNTTLILYYIYY